ncbi:ABC transporter ATP-binding protein [Aquibaculum sediminis]|uniref:ABC transporter ATP-binding protein n=1 Tax=Aquibaculum sediminis TaxID=3231907 RepID=UPI00345318C6
MESVSEAAIEARRLTKIFDGPGGEVRALDNVDLIIRKNEFFTLLGPSGCGKTTLLRLVAGFEQPSGGELLMDGEAIAERPPHRRPVNTVFQSYALFPHMTVAENVGFGLEMMGRPREEIGQRVERMLALVKLEGMGLRRPNQLSGGQQQRVALARALANQPKVLLLDEPLSALDFKLRKEMQIELKRLQSETGITFVFVTHDQEEALTMSDRIAVMSDGNVLQIGSPTEIYEHPTSRFVADFIGETNLLTGRLSERMASSLRFELDSGGLLEGQEDGGNETGARVTLAVRPERAEISREGSGLPARIEQIVYFGTDTHYHLRLDDQTPFVVRHQNRAGATSRYSRGEEVRVTISPDAVRVLQD